MIKFQSPYECLKDGDQLRMKNVYSITYLTCFWQLHIVSTDLGLKNLIIGEEKIIMTPLKFNHQLFLKVFYNQLKGFDMKRWSKRTQKNN
jgi:hypothetical protein